MSMSTVIKVENLSFSYKNGGNFVLNNISFQIEQNAMVMIIGPNGSGKTTLLKILIGLLNPNKGSVSILEEKPDKIRDKVGYVPQKLGFDKTFPITVLEFLKFSHPTISSQSIIKILKNLNIKKLQKSLLGELSGGQLQRVLITKALLGEPMILFLDEPVSGIDIGGEQNFYQLMREIQKDYNVTIIMVSHEINMVSSIATQVICINKTMLCSGTPEKVITPKIIKELYGENVSLYKHHC